MAKLLFVLIIGTLTSLLAGPISGQWVGQMVSATTRRTISLRLYLGDDISGVVSLGDEAKKRPISNAQLHGDALTFELRSEKSIAECVLRLGDQKITGIVSFRGRIAKVMLFGPRYSAPNGISRPILLH